MSLITPVGVDDSPRRLVRRTVVACVLIVVLTTAALPIALPVFADNGGLVLRTYFVTMGLLLSLQLISSAIAAVLGDSRLRSNRPTRSKRNSPPNWPADLFELEDRVSLARVSEFDYESRLRPLLRDLAAARLESRWNVDMSRQPEETRRHLGEELWIELRDAPSPEASRDLPGPTMSRLQALIDGVESI